MKTPETDNQVVDHLYDDLTDAQREAFTAVLESDEDAAEEAQSFATLLKIYRDESEELTPSVAASERLLREAERAHLSIWARLFGDLPKLVMRPAVGFAMVAVLLIGGGVFYVLSQGPGNQRSAEGPHSSASKAAPGDRTVASAPESTTLEGRPVLAERAPSGAAAKGDPAANADGEAFDQDKRVGVQTVTTGNGKGYDYKSSKQGALAAAETRSRDSSREKGLRGRKARRMSKSGNKSYFRMNSRGSGGRAPKMAQPAAKKPAAAPQQLNDAVQLQQKQTKTKAKDESAKKLTPPALHNRANKNLAKGKVAVACGMFGSLVRGHRGYNRRADALLGWARCEMARGSYSRAARLVRQLIKEYPKWKKTGTSMLAQIKRRQSQAALRAQRVRRVKRRAPTRARPRPSKRRSAPTSN